MIKVGDKISSKRGGWKFNQNVTLNFDKHVKKSVPLYDEGHELICDLSDYFIKDNSIIYDLGSSTGTFLKKLSINQKNKKNLKFIGYDNAKSMVTYANKHNKLKNINFKYQDIQKAKFKKCDMIVMNYTLQFVQPSARQDLINKLYQRLNWGGALFLFEKVRAADARFQDILTSAYVEYKIRKGFKSLDIFMKNRSLRGVLEPFSTKANYDMLERAGFVDLNSIQKYICFEGFLAIK